MSIRSRVVFFILAGGALPVFACGSGVAAFGPGPEIDGGAANAGQGVGQPCSDAQRCRPGLACNGGTCAPGRSSPDGTACVISAECIEGSYCGPERKCAPAGPGEPGASCASDADCKSGLRCNVVGLGAQCQPEGDGDVGAQCTVSGDCFGGLLCANGACTPNPPGTPPLGVPTWSGEGCPPEEAGPVSAYFRVPRGKDDGDFFRLPFPNDVRRVGGRPNLAGFPTPGPGILGYDAVARYVDDVAANTDGFSTYGTVVMRFSGEIDYDSFKAPGVVRYVDVGADATNAPDLGHEWAASSGRSAYVCPNALSVRPPTGVPLRSGRTYAVVVSSGAKAKDGSVVRRAPDLDIVLGASAPSDPSLAAAHAAYAPFRTWAAARGIAPSSLASVAVFTVASAKRPAEKLAAAVSAAALPTASGWIRCGDAPSPCPDTNGSRACPAPSAAFDELHALISLPIFQKGTAPYVNPADGGDLAYDGAGTPALQRTEQVCASLTIPKGTPMPTGGWPLVVYAHGTGGSYRSHVNEGVAAALANVTDTNGTAVAYAVLGIDQVAHGPRRAGSSASPNDLFFNFQNPGAARGNPLQGAADQMALVRFARGLDLGAGASPTGAAIRFDRIAFWGHSQGATEGGIAMPYTPEVSGVVLSGAGGSIIDALLTKTSPVNIASAIPLILSDPGNVSAFHPVLSLLQNAIDPADPLNHARALTFEPVSAPLAKHAFVPYGIKDTYSPGAVQSTYVLAAGLALVASPPGVVPDAIGELSPLTAPAGGNRDGRTGVTRQYAPNGYDGHFVAFRDATALADVKNFLADVATNQVPHVGR